jgi:hypothetical protein
MSYRPVSGTTLVTAYPPALAHRNGLEIAPFSLPKAVRPGGPRSKVVEYPNSSLGTGRIGGPLSLAGEEGEVSQYVRQVGQSANFSPLRWWFGDR